MHKNFLVTDDSEDRIGKGLAKVGNELLMLMEIKGIVSLEGNASCSLSDLYNHGTHYLPSFPQKECLPSFIYYFLFM